MLTKSDFRFFTKARHVAAASDFSNVHVGCVAVYQKHIIGIGCNTNKTHPVQLHYNKYRKPATERGLIPKVHAEISCLCAIDEMDINWSKVQLYIYRMCNSREHGIARPCPACMRAIKDRGIKHVYYTTDDGFAYEMVG